MLRLFTIILTSLFFIGCSVGSPKLPTFKEVDPTNLFWEDGVWNGQKVHILTQDEWDYVQTQLIINGMTANQCIKIINNYNNSR